MRLLFEEPHADERTGQCEEGALELGESVEAATQSSEIVQEGVGSLDDPARFAHAAAVVGVAGGEFRYDAEPAEEFSQRLRVVAAVAFTGGIAVRSRTRNYRTDTFR